MLGEQVDKDREPESNELAKKWNERIKQARKHWDKMHRRAKYCRDVAAGINSAASPESPEYAKFRANLIHGTITAMLPSIYARNPDVSCVPLHNSSNLKLLCKTIETVTSRQLERASLKERAKGTVRAAITTGMGAVKVIYQRDLQEDPEIRSRINDAQDDVARLEALLAEIEDSEQRQQAEAKREELRHLLDSLHKQVEVVASEGVAIDRVRIEHLLIDPSVEEFFDYREADWMAQAIPMKKSAAKARYGKKLDGATSFNSKSVNGDDKRIASIDTSPNTDDDQICVLEIWDKATMTVYTLAEGCDYWLREPFHAERVGQRWYPFFLLPFQLVDGRFAGPSLIDLTERLQLEHNDARDKYNEHRKLCLPGWVASAEISEKTIKRYNDSTLGEITILDAQGMPLHNAIMPKQHPPFDPAVYDTGQVRYDWEQVTGLQDASRSTVVKPKTATEASIMQQALSGRVSEFRDQVEDWLQEISQYASQILLQEMTAAQVERMMGAPEIDPMTGAVLAPTYDWPELTKEDVFGMVELRIRAGTTGAPDKLEQQEAWGKMLPVMQQLISQIIQMQSAGIDPAPVQALLRETVARFDERMDVDEFIPQMPQPQMMPPEMQQQLPV